MCWNGHSGQKKVAEKDIEVYKIGRVRDNRFICEISLIRKEFLIKNLY